jgi:hypothetical protein
MGVNSVTSSTSSLKVNRNGDFPQRQGTPPRQSLDNFATTPAPRVDLNGGQTESFPPVPKEWRRPDGSIRNSGRDLEGLAERGFAEGGFKLGVAWLQEAYGLKVDGKFGKGTYDAIGDHPALLKFLRSQRLSETPGAMSRPLKPISAETREKLKNELTELRDKAGDFEKGYEAAVTHLQTIMVRSGEPMTIDGKLGKDTYESMVRLYGKATADDLSRHLQVLKSGDGDM